MCIAQSANLDDLKASHTREIDLKDKMIKSSREDASKWQAMYMSANKVDIDQFKSFQMLLRSSPDKGAGTSSHQTG